MAKKTKDKRSTAIKLGELKVQKPTLINNELIYQKDLSLRDFSEVINIPDFEIIKYFFLKGVKMLVHGIMTENQIKEYCDLHSITVTKKEPLSEEEVAKDMLVAEDPNNAKIRNPIVSILGHVDHGKTTLLDTIRKTRVAEREKGGITQHIGAYVVEYNDKKITFLDTPGHEAFIKMRRRGARATDISIIVVAADDGVKPQTKEAIKHVLEAETSVIVAINKIDKPDIDIEKVKSEVSDNGLMPEEWGGSIPFVEISAKENKNLDELLETILITAEVLNLKAEVNKMPTGIVIEAHLDQHLGPVATLLVQNGELFPNDNIVVGHISGKVRNMTNELKKPIKQALPSTPVRITGLPDVPLVGDIFVGLKSDKEAKEFANFKRDLYISRKKGLHNKAITQSGNKKVINLIMRADTQGSLEAIKGIIDTYKLTNLHINILSIHVGKITQTDVELAISTKANIIAFNLGKLNKLIDSKIKMGKVNIIEEGIIYKVIEQFENVILENAGPIIKKEHIGSALVVELYSYSKLGMVAGCKMQEGKTQINAVGEVLRYGKKKVFEAKIKSLKHFKDDVKEISPGQEFGIVLEDMRDLKKDDIIKFHLVKEEKPKISDLLEITK